MTTRRQGSFLLMTLRTESSQGISLLDISGDQYRAILFYVDRTFLLLCAAQYIEDGLIRSRRQTMSLRIHRNHDFEPKKQK